MNAAAPAAAESSRQVQLVEWPGAAVRLAVVCLAAALGSWLGLEGLRTPPPLPAKEPVFSAERAADTARRVLGTTPRPIGSPANEVAVKRIADWLRSTGMDVEVDEVPVRVGGREVTLRNIVARRSGSMPGPAVMLAAHHDSARASPGAGDDGMGVAIVLEAAGALMGEPWKGRDVLLLLTDGEESGLLGARHFVNNHPWRERIATVINVDNRGNSGPALIYETAGDDDARLLQAIAPVMGPVVANSLFATIAASMPNASDLSVFREAGMHGLNIAVVGGLEHYHASTDDWDHLDRSSLQHEGQMALAALYALATERDDGHKPEGRAVFLDVAGRALAWWPARAGATVAVLCALAVPAAGWFACRQLRVRRSVLVAGAVAAAIRVALAGAVCAALLWAGHMLRLWGTDAANAALPDADARQLFVAAWWPSAGPWYLALAMATGLLLPWRLHERLLRGCTPIVALCGAWMVPAAAIAAVAVLVPGLSAPLLPITVTAALSLGMTLALDPRRAASALPVLAAPAFIAGLTLAPIESLSWTGVGLGLTPFAAIRCALYAAVLAVPITTSAPAKTA